MTRDERAKAFQMRLDGATWETIGENLNYAPTTVRSDLINCIEFGVKTTRCIYPAIRSVINQRFFGSMNAFAAHCGVNYSTIYHICNGSTKTPGRRVTDAILLATDLTYEEAFRKEDS